MTLWKWLRLRWTGFFGYKLRSGNRVRIYISTEHGAVVASFKYCPSVNDEIDMETWLRERAPFQVLYTRSGQRVYEA